MEVEIEGTEKPQRDAETARHSDRSRLTTGLLGLLIGASLAIAAVGGGADAGNGEAPSHRSLEETPTSADASPTTSPGEAPPPAAVWLLPGSADLAGSFALVEYGSPVPSSTVWVVAPNTLATRTNLPLLPRAQDHRGVPDLIVSGEHLAYVAPDGVHLLDRRMDEPSHWVADGRYLVPGATSAMAWAVSGSGTITGIAMDTGIAGPGAKLDDSITWVGSEVGGGFLVLASEEGGEMEWKYWSPDWGFSELSASLGPESRLVHALNSKYLFVSPTNVITMVDSGSHREVAVHHLGSVVATCPSRDMDHVGVVFSEGEAAVIDIASGEVVVDFHAEPGPPELGWTSPTQLVALTDGEVIAVNIDDGTVSRVAGLTSASAWSLTAADSTC